MRVDSLQIPGQGGLKVQTGKGAFTDSLREGDRVTVDVLSSDKNAVVLKTDSGQIFRARLDTGAELLQGDKILLEYSGREGKLVFLSIAGREAPAEDTAAQSMLVRDFDDKSLAPFAGKLADLHMPPTEENSRAMKGLITGNPDISLEEAAFLASNKLTVDEGLLKAALHFLSGGEKTDALLARLIDILDSHEADVQAETAQHSPQETQSPLTDALRLLMDRAVSADNVGTDKQAISGHAAGEEAEIVDTAAANAETENQTVSNAGGAGAAAAPADDSNARNISANVQNNLQGIIAQSDSDLQSRNVLNNVEILQKPSNFVEKSISEPQNSIVLQSEAVSKDEKTALSEEPPNVNATSTAPDQHNAANAPLPTRDAGRVVADLLSDVPEFRGTPPSALERFSNMLLRVATAANGTNDSSGAIKGDTKKLAGLLDEMFTRIDKNAAGAGERLKNAKEELFARLTLIDEAVSRTAPQARAEILEQTQKLTDHIRLLNSIDQFVYMQLPVQIGEERKTAELYMFRRKSGKRIDPENANILLALEL